jgi:hypothetical protein
MMTAAASPYWDIRANIEQTSVCIGLDHYGRGVWGMAEEAITIVGKGIDAWRNANVRCNRSPAEATDTVRDPCWQRP